MFLDFRDNQTNHDDLIFTFNGETKRRDSYYFALDRNIDPENEDVDKIRKVLKRLLEQWLEYAEGAEPDDVLFLPYDFSDQYTGCLRCEVQDTSVSLTDGYLSREAWSVFPSDIRDFVREKSYFTVTNKNRAVMPKWQFVQELKENISAV